MIRAIIVSVIAGLTTGTLGLILACIVCLAITFKTHDPVELPGIFRAWFASVDGLPQLRFLPDWSGMGTALLIWSALAGVLGGLAARRGAGRSRSA